MRLLYLALPLVLAGCANTLQMEVLQPAKIDRAAKTKVLAVMPFDHDRFGLTETLESFIASKKVNGKSFFTVVSRKDIDPLLEEQKLQLSGLTKEENTVKAGQLLGAQGLISGKVTADDSRYSHYHEKRIRCIDKKCKETYEDSVRCRQMTSQLSATIRMVDVERGDIIFARPFSASASYAHCHDEQGGLPSPDSVMTELAEEIAAEFTRHISPHRISVEVELLDDPDIDYSNEQEDQLDAALEYIKLGRLQRAEELLSILLTSTADRCYVAAYDLGIVKELLGEYEKARSLYRLADRLTNEPEAVINDAIMRIEKAIQDHKRLQQQL